MSGRDEEKYEEDEIYDKIFNSEEPFFDESGRILIMVYSFLVILFSMMIWHCTKRKIKFLIDPN